MLLIGLRKLVDGAYTSCIRLMSSVTAATCREDENSWEVSDCLQRATEEAAGAAVYR